MVKTRSAVIQEVALRVASCNLQLDLDLEKFDRTLHIMIEFLKSHPIHEPLTKSIEFPLSIIHRAYSTSAYNSVEDYIEFYVSEDRTTKLYKVEFLEAIGLPESKEEKTFYEPTNKELFDVFDHMGYLPPRLEKTNYFKKGKLPAMWQFLVHIILQCLTGKAKGNDTLNRPYHVLLFGIYTGKEVDFGTTIWKDFVSYVFPKKKEIPCARFWALVLHRGYTNLKISLPKGEKMFTPGTISGYTIPNQSDFGKVARLPEAMLQYIEKNSKALIKHREEMVPLESENPNQTSQQSNPTEGPTSSPKHKKQIAAKVKKTTGLGTKRKYETITSSQDKTQPTQSSTSPIDSSSQADDATQTDDVSQNYGDIAHRPPPSSQKEDVGVENSPEQPIGTYSKVNLEPTLKSSSIPGQESSVPAHPHSQIGLFVASSGEAEVRTLESASVRQTRDEQERQTREQSEREAKERAQKERIAQIDLNEQVLSEKGLRDEKEEEVKAAEQEKERKKRKVDTEKLVNENTRKEDELNVEKQREQEVREKDEALMSNDEIREELEKKAMEEDFAFTIDEGLIQDSESPSVDSPKPSTSKVFLGSSETESEHVEEVPRGTLRTTIKWKKKKKSKYLLRVEFNSLNQKLSEVLEVVKKIPPPEEKFVSKEDFKEMQKIITSIAQSVPNLETREKTLQESIVNSIADVVRDLEHKRTDDTFKYLNRMDEIMKMVKEIQQSYDDLTNTVAHQHRDEISRISEQLIDYRNKNIILQAVLVKVMQSSQQLLRPCNVRFDEVLFAIQKVHNSVDKLPKSLSNNELNKQVQELFLKVFKLIEDLKGSRLVDEAGFSSIRRREDENVVIIDTSEETPPPQPPPKITVPPTESEIHETPNTSIKDKGKNTLKVSEVSRMKTLPVSEEEKKRKELEDELHAKQNSTKEEQHTLTPWAYVIRQLRDDELVPKQTKAPPISDEYQWDIPMAQNAQLSREMQMPAEVDRLVEFFKSHAQPPMDVWSLRRIIKVLGYKKKTFQKKEYFGFEVVRSDNKKYYFSEADFPNLNPNDLYVIGRHLQNKLLTHEPSRFPFVKIQRFLRSLISALGNNPPEEINQDLEGIENRHRGPIDDPELGIIFSDEKDSPRLFFRLKQKHLRTTEFLEKMIDLTLRSKMASAAVKVKIIEELEWWVAVRKWIKRVTDLVSHKT